jgi:hypothetical protein
MVNAALLAPADVVLALVGNAYADGRSRSTSGSTTRPGGRPGEDVPGARQPRIPHARRGRLQSVLRRSRNAGWRHVALVRPSRPASQSLDSNCSHVGGCDAGPPQSAWLEHDLSTRRSRACSRTGIIRGSRPASTGRPRARGRSGASSTSTAAMSSWTGTTVPTSGSRHSHPTAERSQAAFTSSWAPGWAGLYPSACPSRAARCARITLTACCASPWREPVRLALPPGCRRQLHRHGLGGTAANAICVYFSGATNLAGEEHAGFFYAPNDSIVIHRRKCGPVKARSANALRVAPVSVGGRLPVHGCLLKSRTEDEGWLR